MSKSEMSYALSYCLILTYDAKVQDGIHLEVGNGLTRHDRVTGQYVSSNSARVIFESMFG